MTVTRDKFELTANSLGAHTETQGGLILRTLSYLTMNSQDDSHCEVPVNFLCVCNSHSSLLPLDGELIGMISRIAHSKLTV